MADERRGSGRRFGRRRKGRQDRPDRPAAPRDAEYAAPAAESQKPNPPLDCSYCQKPIYDLSTALADPESGGPVHFDCAFQRMADRESLAPGEKLVYIGSGAFAVVEFKDRGENAFTVKRRLAFEEEGKKQDWRRALSYRVSSL